MDARVKFDYLKYWRVIRRYHCLKHEINLQDLEMILFLYTEDYFSKDKFREFEIILGWDRERFERLRQRGFIEVFRKGVPGRKALYDLSLKSKRMVVEIYKNIDGKPLPLVKTANPRLWTKSTYTTKVYSTAVINMNEYIRNHPKNKYQFKKQPRRPSLE